MTNPNTKKVKVADILEAITESFKNDLISEAYYQSEGYANIDDFKEKVPFEEMTVDEFDMEVSDEGSYNSFSGSMFDNIAKMLEAKGYRVKENYEDAPPVRANVRPKED